MNMQTTIIQTSRFAPSKTSLSIEKAKLLARAFIVSFFMLL